MAKPDAVSLDVNHMLFGDEVLYVSCVKTVNQTAAQHVKIFDTSLLTA